MPYIHTYQTRTQPTDLTLPILIVVESMVFADVVVSDWPQAVAHIRQFYEDDGNVSAAAEEDERFLGRENITLLLVGAPVAPALPP